MTLQINLKPEVEARLKAQAQARGVPVEAFIASVIEGKVNGPMAEEDSRLAAMREAMNDELFLADLAETMEDFRHVDCEQHH
ncbi:MAG: hypothetical protein H0T92_09645 [Pyrinomonadaceae bacterium]|jgi:predicted DNA-binding protein|nr:hypothetical protein [Pyrinomonadaceae bacterium]